MDAQTYVLAIIALATIGLTIVIGLQHMDFGRALERLDQAVEHMDASVAHMDRAAGACERAAEACVKVAEAVTLPVRDRRGDQPAE
jgi:hypothetical protein